MEISLKRQKKHNYKGFYRTKKNILIKYQITQKSRVLDDSYQSSTKHITIHTKSIEILDLCLAAKTHTKYIKKSQIVLQPASLTHSNKLVEQKLVNSTETFFDCLSTPKLDCNYNNLIKIDTKNKTYCIKINAKFSTKKSMPWCKLSDLGDYLVGLPNLDHYAAKMEKVHNTQMQKKLSIIPSNTPKIPQEISDVVVSSTNLLISRVNTYNITKTQESFNSIYNNYKDVQIVQKILNFISILIAQKEDYPIVQSTYIFPEKFFVTSMWQSYGELYLKTQIKTDSFKIIDASSSPNLIDYVIEKGIEESKISNQQNNSKTFFYMGEYSAPLNVLSLYQLKEEDVILHELTHFTIKYLNDVLEPYIDIQTKISFQNAIKETTENMVGRLGISSFDSDTLYSGTTLDNYPELKIFSDNPKKVGKFIGLNQNEILLFQQFLNPLFSQYDPSEYDKEFIAIFPQLYMLNINEETIDQYTFPLKEFFSEHILSHINNAIEYHSYICNTYLCDANSDRIFKLNKYFNKCVQEVLDLDM